MSISTTEYLARIAKANQMIEAYLLDADGTGNVFETDQAITDTATLVIPLSDQYTGRFEITEIAWYMNPANAVTYEMYLLEAPFADDVTQLGEIVFDSDPLMAKGQVYTEGIGQGKLPRMADLVLPGRIYYMIDWSAAPGNTPGFIKVRGRKLA